MDPTDHDLRAIIRQLVIAGDDLADKLADLDSILTRGWWTDLENRRDRWAGAMESAARAVPEAMRRD